LNGFLYRIAPTGTWVDIVSIQLHCNASVCQLLGQFIDHIPILTDIRNEDVGHLALRSVIKTTDSLYIQSADIQQVARKAPTKIIRDEFYQNVECTSRAASGNL
jgi:hypothetical protein